MCSSRTWRRARLNGWARARKRFAPTTPRLVVCNITGYGATGPYASKRAYDLLVQSEVGVVSITGTEDTPSRVGISIADIAAGMYAYSGVLTALLARQRTDEGATVDVSLFDSLGEWMGFPVYHTLYSGLSLPRSGPNHASIAPYGPFTAAGGGRVFLAVQNAREWTRFCGEVLRRPEMADDHRYSTVELRVRHRTELHDGIARVCERLSLDEIIRRLEAADIAYSRMNSVAEFITHPQLTSRGRWMDVDSEVGPLRALQPPVVMEGVEPVMGAVPALGQHTQSILGELGFDRATIATWQKEGVI